MQRDSTSSPSPASTPTSSRPNKRPRLSTNDSPSSFKSSPASSHPSTPAGRERAEADLVNDHLASEERKRSEAVEREGWARGETKWYLSVREPKVERTALRVVEVGYSMLDAGEGQVSEDESGEESAEGGQVHGRRTFGNFKRGREEVEKDDAAGSESSSDDEEEEDEEEDDPTGAAALIAETRRAAAEKARAERKAKRKADDSEGKRMAEERRKKHVKLNQLRSISGSGGGSGSPLSRGRVSGDGKEDRACFRCGEKGHEKRDCPRGR